MRKYRKIENRYNYWEHWKEKKPQDKDTNTQEAPP